MLVPRVPSGSKQEGLAVRRCAGSHVLQLAPSTLFAESGRSDIFGFIISYRVRVKLITAQSPLNVVMADMPVFVVAKRTGDHFSHQLPINEKNQSKSSVTFRNRRWAAVNYSKGNCNPETNAINLSVLPFLNKWRGKKEDVLNGMKNHFTFDIIYLFVLLYNFNVLKDLV